MPLVDAGCTVAFMEQVLLIDPEHFPNTPYIAEAQRILDRYLNICERAIGQRGMPSSTRRRLREEFSAGCWLLAYYVYLLRIDQSPRLVLSTRTHGRWLRSVPKFSLVLEVGHGKGPTEYEEMIYAPKMPGSRWLPYPPKNELTGPLPRPSFFVRKRQ